MMDDQKILDNAPKGEATDLVDITGAFFDKHCNHLNLEGFWSEQDICPVGPRSLADIKELVELRNANAEIEKGYEELRMAALHAVCKIGGGQAKADLRDAYDKATEQLEALKEKG
jgi:hypothetical protein